MRGWGGGRRRRYRRIGGGRRRVEIQDGEKEKEEEQDEEEEGYTNPISYWSSYLRIISVLFPSGRNKLAKLGGR